MTAPVALEVTPCPLCGATAFTTRGRVRDLALGIPGEFHLATCDGCGLLYQNPRVRTDQLGLIYPDGYGPHSHDPELSGTFKRRGRAARWVLATQLGYPHVRVDDVRPVDRLSARWYRQRMHQEFPPWTGQGRLLDVGCATGRFMRQMSEIGWRVAGIELDAEAATKARRVTPDVFVGDPVDAEFPVSSFDVVTASHVIEHLPQPLETLRRMLGWLAPGGLVIVEVPNAGGAGGRLFGRYWSGLDFPRHLVHFTPASMGAMVAKAGGRVIEARHRSKPRYLTRSLHNALADRSSSVAAAGLAAMDSRIGRGVLKLGLEMVMPLAPVLRLGEVVRYSIVPA